jgi:hypothetical protein
MRTTLTTLAITCTLVIGRPAGAGLIDSPVPPIDGVKSFAVYSVVGVVSKEPGPNTATYFSCTSTAKSTIKFGVQVFHPLNGASLVFGQAEVAPGATATITTLPAGPISGAIVMGDGGGFSTYPTSARIVATSKSVICTAYVIDQDTRAMTHLTIVAKTKQQGD